jgi:SSS family solute:Na+ symporter
MNLLASALQSSLPLWMVGVYLVVLLGLGIFSSKLFRGTSKDYFVASRSIGPFMLLMSVFGTTMTGFALVGSTGKAFTTGVAVFGAVAVWSGIVHSSVFFIIGTRLWAIGKRLGYVTQVQFFRERFQSHTLGTVLFVMLVLFIIPYLLIGIISAGKFMQGTAGLDPRLTGLVICGVVLTYVFLGGVRSAAWANTFQTLVFMFTGIVAFAMISKSVAAKTEKGSGTFLENVKRSTELVEKVKPERLVRGVHPEAVKKNEKAKAKYQEHLMEKTTWEEMVKDMGAEAVAAMGMEKPKEVKEPQLKPSMSRLLWITYLFIPLSIGMFPHVFQHWLTAKSAKTFRLAIVAHPICIAVVWLPCVIIGTWAAGLHELALQGELQPENIIKPFADLKNPSDVLGVMVGQLVQNPLLTGLLMIGVLAAIMSSLDSQFACLGTMFTNDIVVPWKGKDYYSDEDTVKIARWFVIGVVVAAYLLSLVLMKTASVFNLGMWCFSGFTALFPIVFAALYWKRASVMGAYACIAVTAVLWILWFKDSGYGADKGYTVLGMLPMAPLTILSAVAMIVGSLLSKAPEERKINKFFPNNSR